MSNLTPAGALAQFGQQGFVQCAPSPLAGVLWIEIDRAFYREAIRGPRAPFGGVGVADQFIAVEHDSQGRVATPTSAMRWAMSAALTGSSLKEMVVVAI
jgi:hypothetical protein